MKKQKFNQPVKYNLRTNDHIQKTVISRGDDCTTGSLLNYVYFKEYYEMIANDLNKQQALDADPKSI